MEWRPQLQCWRRLRAKQLETHINMGARNEYPRIGEPIPARDCAGFNTREIQGATLTGLSGVGSPILSVNTAYPHFGTRRHDRDRIAGADLSGKHGSCHYGAVPAQGKNAVNGKTEQALVTARRESGGCPT